MSACGEFPLLPTVLISLFLPILVRFIYLLRAARPGVSGNLPVFQPFLLALVA